MTVSSILIDAIHRGFAAVARIKELLGKNPGRRSISAVEVDVAPRLIKPGRGP